IAIAVSRRSAIARRADDFGISRDVHQVRLCMMMTQRALVRRDLDRKAAHELVCDHEVVPRLLLDRHDVVAGIGFLFHSGPARGAKKQVSPLGLKSSVEMTM